MKKVTIPLEVAETCVRTLKASIKRIKTMMPDPDYVDPYISMSDRNEALAREAAILAREDAQHRIDARQHALNFFEKYLDDVKN